MNSATGTQTERSTLLSRADLDELIKRQTNPGSPVLSVFILVGERICDGLIVELKDFPFSILHFSFAGIHHSWRPMTNGVTTAAHRLESGLVRLGLRGTSALSKRHVNKLLDQ